MFQGIQRCVHSLSSSLSRSLLTRVPITLQHTRGFKKLRRVYDRFSVSRERLSPSETLVYSNSSYLYMLSGYIVGGFVSTCFAIKTVLYLSERELGHQSGFGNTWFDRLSDWWSELNLSSTLAWNLNCIIYPMAMAAICRTLMSRGFVRLYYNVDTEKFRGIRHNLILRKRTTQFTSKDVTPKAPSSFLGLLPGNFYVKGRPYLVDNEDFTSIKYFAIFKGAYEDWWRWCCTAFGTVSHNICNPLNWGNFKWKRRQKQRNQHLL